MKKPVVGLGLLFATAVAIAADGLVPPAADVLWPRWRARIAVQTPALSPLTSATGLDTAALRPAAAPDAAWAGGVHGATILGDYYFAIRSFGAFRASGGLMSGLRGGVPLATIASGPRLGLAVTRSASVSELPSNEALASVPYLGLGFSGSFWRDGPALTADLGLVADRAAPGRAVLGNQGMDDALREIRLSPVMQLGIRYAF